MIADETVSRIGVPEAPTQGLVIATAHAIEVDGKSPV